MTGAFVAALVLCGSLFPVYFLARLWRKSSGYHEASVNEGRREPYDG